MRDKRANLETFLMCALLAALLLRLLSLPLYPLTDTTESRYAEIARKMLETGNWITPQFDYGVPFWGKPPLSFWATAATMAVVGVSEYGARLATFIASLLVGALFFAWPFEGERRAKTLAAFGVMQTSVIGFVASGAVMTDEFLMLGIALCFVSFWKTMTEESVGRIWGYLFFVGLAVGLLAKGPLIFVLAGLPLFLWVLIEKRWLDLWKKFPWITGTFLMLLLAVPWYLAAEQATPGFLRYFIIGEHIERFLVKGWKGDLYGMGHAQVRGMIWLYAFVCAMPWAAMAPFLFHRKTQPLERPYKRYLLFWTLSPMLFFTLASNILPAYVLPALFPFSIFVAEALVWVHQRNGHSRWVWAVSLGMLLIVVAGVATAPGQALVNKHSHKALLAKWDHRSLLYYVESRPSSAQFYSHGRAVFIRRPQLWQKLNDPAQRKLPTTLVMKHWVYNDSFRGDPAWRVIAEDGKWIALRGN